MRALVAGVVLAVVLAPLRARAAPDDELDHEAALAALQSGVAAFRAGSFEAALPQFERARRLAPDKPNPYRWLALTQVQLGDCRAALRNIAAFAERVPPDDRRLDELIRLREMCEQTGVLTVASTPSGAALRIDGAHAGKTPYQSLAMRAGEHELTASLPGYARHSQTIEVTPGGTTDLHLRLDERPRGLTERWWFWAAVATAAVGAVAVVAIASDGDDTTLLDPVQCDAAGCRTGGM